MKHTYSWLLLAALATSAQAQRVNQPHLPSWARPEHAPVIHPQAADLTGGQFRDAGDVVFSEDFANGLAGNNGVGAWTTGEVDGDLWRYSFSQPYGAYTGHNGSEIITSTTAANGFMMINADSANTNWSDTTQILPGTNWDAALVSPEIDLSANPYVNVVFEMAGRWCCNENPFYVQVSTNGGNTWSGSYQALPMDINAGSGTVTATVNIAGGIVIGNPSTVTFRFMFAGTLSSSSHYHWQVDDVKLVVSEDYDLILQSAAHSDWDPDLAFSYDSLRYSVFPYSQLRPVPLNMTVSNYGSQPQTGTVLNFKVMEGANTVLDQDQIVDIPAGLTQKHFVNPDFVPPAVEGTYNVTYSATSVVGDPNTNDNDATSNFKVKEFSYGRDLGTTANYVQNTGVGEYELCNAFHIVNAVDLYSIDVAIRSGGTPSPVGYPILGVLRDGNDVTADIAETMDHEILSSELNGSSGGSKFISMIFQEPQPLEAGTDYIVCVKHLGEAELRTATNGVSEPQSSYIWYDQPDDMAGITWFYTTTTPMVRMNFNPSVGIEEGDRQNGIGLGQNLPNPARDITRIPYDLKEASNVTLEVHDLSGKLVATVQEGNRPAGSHRLSFDVTGLNEGVYFYSLIANGTRLTKRMTVIH